MWIIGTHNGVRGKFPRIDIEEYPAVKAHLDQYWDKIAVRDDQGATPYNLRNCAYWEDFDKPKIVWPSVGETFYCFVPAEYLLLDTNYFFPTDNPNYFTALLNSKLITWWINSEDTQIGPGGAYRHYKYNLEKLSLPQEISLLTDCNLNESHNEELFDKIINDFYGLTEEEINYIEALRNN